MQSSGCQSQGPAKREFQELKWTVGKAQSVLGPGWELEDLWLKTWLAAQVLGPSKCNMEVPFSKVLDCVAQISRVKKKKK